MFFLDIILYILFLGLPFLVILAAIYDIYSYTIPNIISLLIVGTFYLWAFLHPDISLETILYHSLIGLSIFVISWILFSFGIFGGGDAKIISAIAFWLPISYLGNFFYYLCFTGGIISLLILIFRAHACYPFILKMKSLSSLYFGPSYGDAQKNSIPYGVAIAFALCIALPQTPL